MSTGAERREIRQKIRDRWVSNDFTTIGNLCKEFGINVSTFNKWRLRNNWDELKAEVQRQADNKAQKELATKIAEASKVDFAVFNKGLAIAAQHFKFWKGEEGEEFPLKIKDFEDLRDSIAALKDLAATLSQCQKGRRIALGVEDGSGKASEPEQSFRIIIGAEDGKAKNGTLRDKALRLIADPKIVADMDEDAKRRLKEKLAEIEEPEE